MESARDIVERWADWMAFTDPERDVAEAGLREAFRRVQVCDAGARAALKDLLETGEAGDRFVLFQLRWLVTDVEERNA